MFKYNKLNISSLFAITSLTFSFSMVSCRKCMKCTSESKATGNITYTYPEGCGKKKTLDAQELNYRANLEDSLTLTCDRN